MNPLSIFWDYFEVGRYTIYLVVFLALLAWKGHDGFKARSGHLVLAAIVAGLLLRAVWCGFSSHVPQTQWSPSHMLESDVTNVHAIELTKGIWFEGSDGQPSGRRPIGYPLVLGLCYALFGVHTQVFWALHLVLFAASAYFLYGIARCLLPDEVSAWPVLFYALYPVSIYSVVLPTDEHLFLPLFFGGLWMLIEETRGRRIPASFVWYGLLFGLATMTRTHSIFMPAVVALAALFRKLSWKKALAVGAGTMLVMQLVNLPWVVRNYRAWGVPVLYTATSSFVYAQVNSTANAKGEGHIPLEGEKDHSPELEEAMRSGNQGRIHQLSGQLMKRWILTHPAEFLWMGTGRLLIFLGWNRMGVWPIWFQYFDGSFDPARPLPHAWREAFEEAAYISYYIVWMSLLFSAAFAPWLSKGRRSFSRDGWWILAAVFVFWGMEHMIIYPDRKYRFPLEPLFMVAAVPLWCWFATLRKRPRA